MDENTFLHHEQGDTVLRVFKDSYDKYKTTVLRPETLDSNTLYHGYELGTALKVAGECLERFEIDEVDELDDIQWSSD